MFYLARGILGTGNPWPALPVWSFNLIISFTSIYNYSSAYVLDFSCQTWLEPNTHDIDLVSFLELSSSALLLLMSISQLPPILCFSWAAISKITRLKWMNLLWASSLVILPLSTSPSMIFKLYDIISLGSMPLRRIFLTSLLYSRVVMSLRDMLRLKCVSHSSCENSLLLLLFNVCSLYCKRYIHHKVWDSQ